MPVTPEALQAGAEREARRLLWRCRRGMRELDIVLARFARETLPGATPAERQALAELLELPDPLLAAWLLGETPPAEGRFAALAARIRDLCRSGGAAAVSS
jgi:antitoxin CptB